MTPLPEHQQELITFLRLPSVSTDTAFRPGVLQCAEWVRTRLEQAGLHVALHQTPGYPVVIGRSTPRPGLKTVLIYGHYDVQPVDPLNLWKRPPFEPHIENGIITARGASDNKGQILAHILGVESQVLAGDLPVNVIFLIEGEEEIGSPNLFRFIDEHKEELQCDVIIISDTTMAARGKGTLTYGLRGLVPLEITVTGPARDLHSGIFGGAVVNPISVLAGMINSLHFRDGAVAIPDFYESVHSLKKWEREEWSKSPLQESRLLEITGAPRLGGEAGFTPLERMWARPTAEVNGFYGGYQGEGTKTVLPREAHAKLTFRLVPDQDPETILDLAEAYLKSLAPPTVRLTTRRGHGGRPYLTDPHSGFGLAAQKALISTFGSEPALIREGGSIPIVEAFRRTLNADTLLLGLALPDCNAHSPNETFLLENLAYGLELNRALLREIAVV
ncbi:MAG: dipeptidase [Candidatus Methylacidiphilales bacterium]|nr:dipeptidase [Candidatus Methylacidiphilales bacterium]